MSFQNNISHVTMLIFNERNFKIKISKKMTILTENESGITIFTIDKLIICNRRQVNNFALEIVSMELGLVMSFVFPLTLEETLTISALVTSFCKDNFHAVFKLTLVGQII
jgi:hypothetical protein